MTERRLSDVDHTPPHDSRNPVQRRYQRGPHAVPDGGAFDPERAGDPDERNASPPETDPSTDRGTLKDVDHTPPDGDGVNHVYRRGTREE